MNAILERFLDDENMGVFGKLFINGKFYAYTVEQPWANNKPFKSCVPVGEYDLVHYDSPKYNKTFALENSHLDVYAEREDAEGQDRYACLLHPANWSHQLQGCIAFGQKVAWGKHKTNSENLMVTNSKYMTNEVLKTIDRLGINKLLIRWKHS